MYPPIKIRAPQRPILTLSVIDMCLVTGNLNGNIPNSFKGNIRFQNTRRVTINPPIYRPAVRLTIFVSKEVKCGQVRAGEDTQYLLIYSNGVNIKKTPDSSA